MVFRVLFQIFVFVSDSLVGVHCTHGLNRTGYMVCRYMRDRLGISPHDAIKGKQLFRL